MGGLLHSKTFRTNLLKWFVVYIGVLGIITTVVTYSKYISQAASNDTARPAKFNVTINNTKICSTTSAGLCDLAQFKPYDELEYYFTADLTELEVRTTLVLNITVDSEYEVLEFTDVDNSRHIDLRNMGAFNGNINDNIQIIYKNDNDITIQLIQEVAPSVDSLNYIVTVKLKNANYNTSYENKFVKIGYSATQVD